MQIPKLPMIHLGHHSVFSNVKFFCFSTDAWSLRDISHYIEKWELSCPADVLIPYLIHPGHSQYEHMHLQLCLLSFWYCQHLKQCIIACHLVNLPFLTCWYLCYKSSLTLLSTRSTLPASCSYSLLCTVRCFGWRQSLLITADRKFK